MAAPPHTLQGCARARRRLGPAHVRLRAGLLAALLVGAVANSSQAAAERLAERFDEQTKTVTLIVLGGAAGLLAWSDVEQIEEVGDVLQIGLPLAALGRTYAVGDRRGRRDFLFSVGTSTLTVALLKEVVDKARPNALGLNSFPSGHTAGAFSGASFLNLRYGPRWGAPALVLAAYTGASRVRAQKHFLDDVISGMSISLLANRYFTFPIDEDVQVVPVVGDGESAVMVRWRGSGRRWRQRSFGSGNDPERGMRYEWEFGASGVDRNDFAAPGGADSPGTGISFLFDETANPTVTARIELGYRPRQRQEVVFELAPFEVRDFGRLAADVSLGGTTVPAGEDLRTRFLLHDYRLLYRYRMRPRKRVRVDAGGGISFQDIVAGLSWADGEARVEEGNFIPFAHVDSEIAWSDRLMLIVEADVGRSGEDRLSDAALALRYRLHPRWDLSGGMRRIERKVVTDQVRNELERNQVVIALAYSF